MSQINTLANALQSAETGLVAQINAGTARLERVGESLPAELARLQEAAQLAKQRMTDAVATFRATVADVATFAEQLSAELFAELVPDVMAEPAPATAPAPEAVQPQAAAAALPADPFPGSDEPVSLPAGRPAGRKSKARQPIGHAGAAARLNGRAKSKAGH